MRPAYSNLPALLLIGYLTLILAVLPCRAEGALLKSEPSALLNVIPGDPGSDATIRLMHLGLSRQEAHLRVSSLLPHELTRLGLVSEAILTGAGVQYPHQDVVNEVVYVLIIILVITGATGVIAYSTFK